MEKTKPKQHQTNKKKSKQTKQNPETKKQNWKTTTKTPITIIMDSTDGKSDLGVGLFPNVNDHPG